MDDALTRAVEDAFAAVPRDGFLPRGSDPRLDAPVQIGHGQTNSQPRTVAAMLRLLAVGPGDRVLDVGAGSGWTTALLAQLTGPEGEVYGVEIVPELAAWGAANLAEAGLPWARLGVPDPGVLGWPAAAPYDRVLVSADAPELPGELIDQLATGGRMVVPVQGAMTLVVQGPHGPEVSTHGAYRFVPLR